MFDTDTDPRQETNLVGEGGPKNSMRELLVDALHEPSVAEDQ